MPTKSFHGHRVLLATFILNLVSFGVFSSTGLYLEPLGRTFGSSGGDGDNNGSGGEFDSMGMEIDVEAHAHADADAMAALLPFFCTIQIACGLLSSLLGGIAQDHFSSSSNKGLQFLVFLGGALLSAGLLWTSTANSLASALFPGACFMGVGLGLTGLMSAGICVLWFEARRGSMLMIAMSGQGLGVLLFSRGTAALLERYGHLHDAEDAGDDYGVLAVEDPWRPSMRATAMVCFVLCSAASASMRLPLAGEVEAHEEGTAGVITGTASWGGQEEDCNCGMELAEQPQLQQLHEGQIELKALVELTRDRHETLLHDPREQQLPHRKSAMSILAETRLLIRNFFSTTSNNRVGLPKRKQRSSSLGEYNAINYSPMHFLKIPAGVDDIDDEVEEDKTNLTLRLVEDGTTSPMAMKMNTKTPTLRKLALSQTALCLNAFTLLASFPFLVMQVHLPMYASTIGLGTQAGGRALSLLGTGVLSANLTFGPLADRLGARWTTLVSFAILGILYWVWPHCRTESALCAIAYLYGYFSSTQSSMPLVILADAYGESSSDHILKLHGILNLCKVPGYLVGPSIAGWILSKYNHGEGTSNDDSGYGAAGMASGVAMICGAAMLLAVPSPEEQRRRLRTSGR